MSPDYWPAVGISITQKNKQKIDADRVLLKDLLGTLVYNILPNFFFVIPWATSHFSSARNPPLIDLESFSQAIDFVKMVKARYGLVDEPRLVIIGEELYLDSPIILGLTTSLSLRVEDFTPDLLRSIGLLINNSLNEIIKGTVCNVRVHLDAVAETPRYRIYQGQIWDEIAPTESLDSILISILRVVPSGALATRVLEILTEIYQVGEELTKGISGVWNPDQASTVFWDELVSDSTLNLPAYNIGEWEKDLGRSSGKELITNVAIPDHLVDLDPTDAAAIMAMENELGVRLNQDPKSKEPCTMTVKDHYVIGLQLIHCNLESLPDSIRKIKHLATLKVDENNITVIPPWISELKSLETFSIQQNNLTNLPSEIGDIELLRVLCIEKNQITSLPTKIGCLKRLEILTIQANKIEGIPEEIGNLRSLRTLWAEENVIQGLPNTIGHLQNLQTLKIEKNNIKSLPDSIGNLMNLEYFYVSLNKLIELPDSLGNCQKLRVLDISSNPVEILPSSLIQLEKLEQLDLRGTKLQSLPDYIKNFPRMKSLRIPYKFESDD